MEKKIENNGNGLLVVKPPPAKTGNAGLKGVIAGK